ncbi:hypothetical protein BDF14DRAFT_1356204 [Spinellus fusiger]|nr:hypothetical protein BDF14DRAFT_1356204 [Spinellus fusiger]
MKRKSIQRTGVEVQKTLLSIVFIQSNRHEVCSSRRVEDIYLGILFSESSVEMIRNLFDLYATDYNSSKGSIDYGCKTNPLMYLKVYYRLSNMCLELQSKSFSCFPLKRTFIPKERSNFPVQLLLYYTK